jgi:hypothetical protein
MNQLQQSIPWNELANCISCGVGCNLRGGDPECPGTNSSDGSDPGRTSFDRGSLRRLPRAKATQPRLTRPRGRAYGRCPRSWRGRCHSRLGGKGRLASGAFEADRPLSGRRNSRETKQGPPPLRCSKHRNTDLQALPHKGFRLCGSHRNIDQKSTAYPGRPRCWRRYRLED